MNIFTHYFPDVMERKLEAELEDMYRFGGRDQADFANRIIKLIQEMDATIGRLEERCDECY
jgi:hypothetical protein